ncbi:HTH-type transcriptional activator mta [Lachnospiraceae bacterium]|jgi:DNA-binding transcriptional MerR regulator|nr:HTH-type transcriptional activator mta [Lachnospiraceae bacterium]
MRTISQVAELTGISTRTLQYYDEIGLLKPTELTKSGYRLYDDEAMQKLQQILFFKELGFKLKEIKELLQKPDFDRIKAFKRQKELLLLKRNRTDRLIQLLSRLEKGEQCMSFQEFDLSDYISALEDFKNSSTDDIIKYWGSIENFDLFIQKIKDDESEVAKLAIQHFGSIEKYTETMKHNLEHFSELMETQLTEEVEEIGKQSDILYGKLTADLSEDVSSPKIQSIVYELLQFIQKNSTSVFLDKPCINVLIDTYSSDYIKSMTDSKYGKGASDYIVKALRYYSENNIPENT